LGENFDRDGFSYISGLLLYGWRIGGVFYYSPMEDLENIQKIEKIQIKHNIVCFAFSLKHLGKTGCFFF